MVAHFAYLAEQRARIATQTAQLRSAEASLVNASEQRSRMQAALAARERERGDLEAKQAQLAAEQAAAQKRMADERALQLSSEINRLQSEMSELKARETDRGWVLTLRNDVLFDSGSARLKPGGEKALEHLAQLMQKQGSRAVAIEGFTDSTGSAEANRRLSEARAAAVKQVLVARGVDPKRIETRGYGPAYPVASNDTPVGRQLNRRVEVVIAPPSPASSGGATR
jgi:outer membrane protein OmpA-like peptidoglycan-associated protein